MRKVLSFALAVLFVYAMAITGRAEPALDAPNGQMSFTEIDLGGKEITIPVFSEVITATSNARTGEQQEAGELITLYLPVTDEGLAYNEEYLQTVKKQSRASGTATDSYPDPNNYMVVTSYIRYTISGATCDGEWVDDFKALITNVAITKDKSAESLGNGGYLIGISNPSAYVVCTGFDTVGSSESYNQTTTLSLAWSSSGMNTPSSWVPVVRYEYSDYCVTYARYSFSLTYNMDDGLETIPCTFTHTLSK